LRMISKSGSGAVKKNNHKRRRGIVWPIPPTLIKSVIRQDLRGSNPLASAMKSEKAKRIKRLAEFHDLLVLSRIQLPLELN